MHSLGLQLKDKQDLNSATDSKYTRENEQRRKLHIHVCTMAPTAFLAVGVPIRSEI